MHRIIVIYSSLQMDYVFYCALHNLLLPHAWNSSTQVTTNLEVFNIDRWHVNTLEVVSVRFRGLFSFIIRSLSNGHQPNLGIISNYRNKVKYQFNCIKILLYRKLFFSVPNDSENFPTHPLTFSIEQQRSTLFELYKFCINNIKY